MGISNVFRRLVGRKGEPPVQEVVGTITDSPELTEGGSSGGEVMVFHLDFRPELEFRQPVSAMSPERKRGDRIKVSYRVADDDVAVVEWIEKVALESAGREPRGRG